MNGWYKNFRANSFSLTQLSWLLVLLSVAILLPSIGATDFHTKGEPREVSVAYFMLQQHDFILPVDNAGDIPYKPPMFYWLMALSGIVFGSLSEFACRFPSALALIGFVVVTFRFYASDRRVAILTAIILLTSFECFRAGTNCRVDMVLTFFMCAAMMLLFQFSRKGRRKWLTALGIILSLSCAALTKGPVGVFLPLAVWWIYSVLISNRWWLVTLFAFAFAVLSLILPALYYMAAWERGGAGFLALAYEENFGRLLGTMSYDSHVKPLWYNFTSLITGWMPWTVIFLVMVLALYFKGGANRLPKRIRQRLFSLRDIRLYSLVAVLVVFFFYCIPSSKRSVYLLPLYPFLAFFIARGLIRMQLRLRMSGRCLRVCTCTICVLYPILFGAVLPMVLNAKSDRTIAGDINRIVPSNEPVYTFIPDRFMRYYIMDYYLGYRMYPLLPSGQTMGNNFSTYAGEARFPADSVFYVAVSSKVWEGNPITVRAENMKGTDFGFRHRLEMEGLEAEKIYTSPYPTHDIQGNLILLKLHRRK